MRQQYLTYVLPLLCWLTVGGVLGDGDHAHHHHQGSSGPVGAAPPAPAPAAPFTPAAPYVPAASAPYVPAAAAPYVPAAAAPSPIPASFTPENLAYANEQSDYYSYASSEGNGYGDYNPQQPSDIVGLIADNDRQGLELLVTAPIVLTVFAAAMAGALFAPVLSRGIERIASFRFELPKFLRWDPNFTAAANETLAAVNGTTEVLDEARRLEDVFPWMEVLERTIDVFQTIQENKYNY